MRFALCLSPHSDGDYNQVVQVTVDALFSGGRIHGSHGFFLSD